MFLIKIWPASKIKIDHYTAAICWQRKKFPTASTPLGSSTAPTAVVAATRKDPAAVAAAKKSAVIKAAAAKVDPSTSLCPVAEAMKQLRSMKSAVASLPTAATTKAFPKLKKAVSNLAADWNRQRRELDRLQNKVTALVRDDIVCRSSLNRSFALLLQKENFSFGCDSTDEQDQEDDKVAKGV